MEKEVFADVIEDFKFENGIFRVGLMSPQRILTNRRNISFNLNKESTGKPKVY